MLTTTMRLQFLGATDTVTGSKYLLQHGKSNVLVDCGLFQGHKPLRLRNWAPLPVEAASIDAVVLTHAHLDHSGYIPLLVKQGFRGKIYCSEPTRDLCHILLPDSGYLQEEQAEYANRHSFSKHVPALPLYTRSDAEHCLKYLHPMPWNRDWSIVPGLHCRLSPVGHMPGAAFVRLDDGSRSVLFSGDIGRPNDLVLLPPSKPVHADYLVVESTYGDRLHPSTDVLAALADVINRTVARGGAVIIPAFAVGRAQMLMYAIHLLKKSHAISTSLPIFLNSPMAAAAVEVYSRHQKELRLSAAQCQAMVEAAEIVGTPDESRQLNTRHGPMVIIAGSGMATGGRVVHHLKAFAPDRRNTILLAGFQAAGTRGATLASGASSVRIHGQDVPIRAEVAKLDQLSAHADAAEIITWLRGLDLPPRKTFITHGEPAAADALRQRIERELRWDCHLPFYLESVALE